ARAADGARQEGEQPGLGPRLRESPAHLTHLRRAVVHEPGLLSGRGSRGGRGQGVARGQAEGPGERLEAPTVRARSWVLRGAPVLLALAIGASLTPAQASGSGSARAATHEARTRPPRPSYVPKIGHVFVINIENKGYDETFGPDTKSPYLAGTLRRKGV